MLIRTVCPWFTMSCLSSESGNQPIVLGPNILLFPPPQQSAPDSAASQQPSVVILCTWLGGATERRVRKYSTGYRALYQSATILVIRTVLMDLTIRSFAAIRSRLAPARQAISSILQGAQNEDGSPKPALLHIFSHGGCNTAIQLMASMSSEERTLLHERLRLVVFDCCPGDTSFERAYEAGLLSLPPQMPFRSTLGTAAVYAFVSLIHGLQAAGIMLSVDDMRQELNQPSVFGPGARRLYLFSDEDRAVAPQDVISHAEQGEMAGFSVETARFNDSPHCSLLLEDATKYWGLIGRHWKEQQQAHMNRQEESVPPPKL